MDPSLLAQPSSPRVAHLVISLENGGLEHLVTRWTTFRNQRSENSTHIICLDKLGVLASDFHAGAVYCIEANRAKFPWDKSAVKRLVDLLKTLKINIIHSHNIAANQYAVIAARSLRIPVIHTQHGNINLDDKGIKSVIRNRILSYFTKKYVAVSSSVAFDIHKTHGISLKKVKYIANGVEEHMAMSQSQLQRLQKTHNIPHDSFILGSAGRLANVKAWDLFLPVFARLARQYTGKHPLHLLLVGDGPEHKRLQNIVKDLALEDRVTFAGFQRECQLYYDMMHLFVLPSHAEGLSVSLLEAMQAGCPVAVTAVGEHTKLIEASDGGILLTPGQPESWQQPLSDFLNDPEKLKSCASKGQAHVKTFYTLASTCQSYETLYQTFVTN